MKIYIYKPLCDFLCGTLVIIAADRESADREVMRYLDLDDLDGMVYLDSTEDIIPGVVAELNEKHYVYRDNA